MLSTNLQLPVLSFLLAGSLNISFVSILQIAFSMLTNMNWDIWNVAFCDFTFFHSFLVTNSPVFTSCPGRPGCFL